MSTFGWMRVLNGWRGVVAASLVTLRALPLHAASSSTTVGVVIIMPERTDRSQPEEPATASDPLDEPLPPPAARGMVRTTTFAPGDGGRLLITDVPEL